MVDGPDLKRIGGNGLAGTDGIEGWDLVEVVKAAGSEEVFAIGLGEEAMLVSVFGIGEGRCKWLGENTEKVVVSRETYRDVRFG